MARIVYITNGMASTLNSGFEMTHRLIAAGHEVSWLSDRETSKAILERGFEIQVIDSDQEFLRQVQSINERFSKSNPVQLMKWWRTRRELRRQSIANDEIARKVQELSPDLLLIDYEMHYAIIATKDLGIPVLLPIVWFSIFFSPELPPLHTYGQPPTNFQSRLVNRLAWARLTLERRCKQFFERCGPVAIRRLLRPVVFKTHDRSDLRKVGSARNYSLKKETATNHWVRPHAYTNLPVLCYNVFEMEFPHHAHANMHYVGPMIDKQRSDHGIDRESNERWESFLKRRSGENNPGPLIYCSLGTYWSTDKTMIQEIIQTFRNRPDWQLVVGLGGKSSAEAFADVPENVLVLDFAPQLKVIQHAAAAITHGGITSINEYIDAGLPMLVCSTGHVDQNGCSARIKYHGLGLVTESKSISSNDLEQKVAQLLTDENIKTRVIAMQQTFAKYRNQGRAIQVIENALTGRGSR